MGKERCKLLTSILNLNLLHKLSYRCERGRFTVLKERLSLPKKDCCPINS